MATQAAKWSKCLKKCGGKKKPKKRSALLACARKCLRGKKRRRKARRKSKFPRACSSSPKAKCPKKFCRVTRTGRVCVYKRTKPKPRRRSR